MPKSMVTSIRGSLRRLSLSAKSKNANDEENRHLSNGTIKAARRDDHNREDAPTKNSGGVAVVKQQLIVARGTPKTFLDLPLEIILEIMKYLPTEDTACLAMCNKKLYQQIGKGEQVLVKLILDDEARKLFLMALRRDVDVRLVYCDDCHFLHRLPNDLELPKSLRGVRYRCAVSEIKEKSQTWFHSGFGFGNVQIASEMNRRRSPLLSSYLDKEMAQQGFYNTRSAIVYDFTAKVLEDNWVVIRKQEWVLFSQTDIIQLIDDDKTFNICAHFAYGYFRKAHPGDISAAEKGLRCIKVGGDVPPSKDVFVRDKWAHLELHQCRYCPTDFRLDFGFIAPSCYAVVLTKWMVLGQGESRTTGLWPLHFSSHRRVYSQQPGDNFSMFEGDTNQNDYQPLWTKRLGALWKKSKDQKY